MNTKTPKWIEWAREIFSLSQAGLTYSKNEFDLERYKRLQEITAEMVTAFAENLYECSTCGQCVNVCPTAAFLEKSATDEVWAALADPGKRVIAQIAPSRSIPRPSSRTGPRRTGSPRTALLPFISSRCVEAGQPASTPLASDVHYYPIFEVNPMPINLDRRP